ncbi:MAG: oligosaccharide flippase family protein [Paraglaciecola sp.]|uniref:lipopolysaccharide biosynthesis protein n=1 Tax=Paraglaciecola sp. TaxID=1920173 RepID=UPI003267762F
MKINVPKSVGSIAKLLSTKVFTKAMGVIVLAIYTRLLTKDELVVIPLFFMLTSIAAIPLNFGIYPILVKKLPLMLKNDISEGKKLFWTCASFLSVGGLIVSVLIYLFSDFLAELLLNSNEQKIIIELTSIACFLFVIESIADRLLWATERFGKTARIQLTIAIVRPIITISCYFSFGLMGLVGGLVLSQLLTTLLSAYYLRDYLFKEKPQFLALPPVLKESLPFYAESFLMYFRREGDNWFVTVVLGPSSLSIYYVAKTVYTAFNAIYDAIDRVIVTRYAKEFENKDFKNTIQKTNDYLVQIIIPFIFISITFLPVAILLVGGNEFAGAIYPASILLLALLISIMRIPLNRAMFVATKSKFRLYMTLTESIFLGLSLALLAPYYGIAGIAISRVIAQIGGAAYGVIMVGHILNIYLRYKLFFTVLILSTLSFSLVYFSANAIFAANSNILIVAIYGLICWLLSYGVLSFLFNKDLPKTIYSLINKNV